MDLVGTVSATVTLVTTAVSLDVVAAVMQVQMPNKQEKENRYQEGLGRKRDKILPK